MINTQTSETLQLICWIVQRDAMKIRETLDDDRQNRIEAAATLSHAGDSCTPRFEQKNAY